MLVGACVENASPEAAEKAFAALEQKFFDLNEVRVSTVRELAEVMSQLPDAEDAARRVKQILQSVFEARYSFDLDGMKKQNIGQAVKELSGYDGATPFVVAYTTQMALGGHSIPVSDGGMRALVILDIVSEADAAKHKVPGLERAVPKNKGVEYGALLVQLGSAIRSNPYSPTVRKILLEIDAGCKDRLPKRPTKKKKAPEKPAKADKTLKKTAPAKKTKKEPAKKPAVKKKSAAKKAAKKKTAATKKTTKKSATKRLARRKPR
jgi:hypothetical protein